MTDNDESMHRQALKDPDYFLLSHDLMVADPVVQQVHELARAKRSAMRECCAGKDTFEFTDYSTRKPGVRRTECWTSMQHEYTNTFRSCFAAYTKQKATKVELTGNSGGIKLTQDIPNKLFWSHKRDGVRVRFYGNGHIIRHRLKPQTPQSVFGINTRINLGPTLPTASEAESQVRRELIHAAIKTYEDALGGMFDSEFMFDGELICTNPRGSDYANGDKMYPAINTAAPTWELVIFDCFYLNGEQLIVQTPLVDRLAQLQQKLKSVDIQHVLSFATQTEIDLTVGNKQTTIATLCQTEWDKDPKCKVEGIVFRGETDFWSLKVKPTGMYTVIITGIQPSAKQGNVVSATLDFEHGPVQISVLNRNMDILRTGGMNVYLTGYARNPINIFEKNQDAAFNNTGYTKWRSVLAGDATSQERNLSYMDWGIEDALGKLMAVQNLLLK